jgi:iron(III) transport system substrate-binding protein
VELRIFYGQPKAKARENIGRVKRFGVLLAVNQRSVRSQLMIQIASILRARSARYRTTGRCRARIFIISAAKVLLAVLLLYSSGSAAENPTSDSQSQWQRVVAAAQKEGKVVVSLPPGAELRKALKEGFERRFGIELELVTGRGSAIVRKIAEEHRAGVQFVDVHTGGSGTIIYGLAGIVEPVESQFVLPEVKDPKNWWGGHMYVDKAQRYAYSFLAFVQEAIWYNTELMKPEEIRSYEDLLQPKWKGKIGYSDPRTGGAGQGNWTFLWRTKGEEFLKKLVQQNLVIMREERPLAELLVKGSIAITIGLDIDNFGPFVKAGLPVKPLPQLKDGIYPVTGSGTLAVIKNPPHPNATKLFTNWFLSREGQETYQKAIGEPTRRLDVDAPKEPYAVRPAREFMSVEQYYQLENHTEDKQETVRKPAIAAAKRLIK